MDWPTIDLDAALRHVEAARREIDRLARAIRAEALRRQIMRPLRATHRAHPLTRRYRRILRALRDPDDRWMSEAVYPSAPSWVYDPAPTPWRPAPPTHRPRRHTAPLHRRAPIRAAGWTRAERDAARRRRRRG